MRHKKLTIITRTPIDHDLRTYRSQLAKPSLSINEAVDDENGKNISISTLQRLETLINKGKLISKRAFISPVISPLSLPSSLPLLFLLILQAALKSIVIRANCEAMMEKML